MRWYELLCLIERTPDISPEELARHFGVSVRTIRQLVHQANGQLQGRAEIRKQYGGGYTVHVFDRDAYQALLDAHATASHVAHAVPATHDERVAYVTNDLLMRDGWIMLDDLADACACSRSTLSLVLRDVERQFERFDLTLERRPRFGMRVSGPEANRRLCMAASVMAEPAAGGGKSQNAAKEGRATAIGSWLRDMGISRDVLAAIGASVEDALADGCVHINAVAYQNLLVHIAIALVRIEADAYVPYDAAMLADMASTDEYRAARVMASGIEERLDVTLPEAEVAYIAVHLAGKRTVYDSLDVENLDSNLVISDEIWSVVGEMLDTVRERFHFDFHDDLELRMNLARHLVPLAVRLRSQMMLKNPLLSDIRTRYPLAWSMAAGVSETLQRSFGALPSNDEMGYIALAFALALERQRDCAPRKRLLVVCASGAGSARLLKYRCQREFGDCVSSIDTCDVMHIGDIDFADIDYVFTTVPIPYKLPVPVREVSYFLDAADVEGVRDLLRGGAGVAHAEDHFRPELFFTHLPFTSKDDVLRFLCDAARRVHGGCDELEALVFEREASAATSFGNDVAMPHPLRPVSDDTFVVVGLLDRPVAWDELGTSVRAVFLVCFSRAGGPALDAFISVLADLFTDADAIARLLETQDWETLLALLKRVTT